MTRIVLYPVIFFTLLFVPTFLLSQESLRLGFTGDILQSYQLDPYLKNYGQTYPFTLIYKRLQSYDILCGNLECPIAEYGSAVKNKRFYFKADPAAASALRWSGFDVLSLANNHTLDFGDPAFFQTMEILEENEIKQVGGGRNSREAMKMGIIQSKGMKVGFIAYNMIPPDYYMATESTPGVARVNKDILRKSILDNKDKVDILVIMFHWGVEYQHTPLPEQKELGRYAIDWGADIVIGTHPHVVQPLEMYKGKPIAYSLGNFVFGSFGDPPEHTADYGLILEIDIKKNKKMEIRLVPVNVFNYDTKFISRELSPSKALEFFNFFNRLSVAYNTLVEVDGNSGRVQALK